MKDLNKLICNILKIDEKDLTDELTPDDAVYWDSLAQFELISSIESNYHVTFDAGEIFSIVNIGDLKSILEKKINQ